MNTREKRTTKRIFSLLLVLSFIAMIPTATLAKGYDKALQNVNSYNAVFEVSLGNPDMADCCQQTTRDSPNCASVASSQMIPGQCQRRNLFAAIDHSDIRGLDTA